MARSFNGTNDSIDLGNSSAINLTTTATIAGWIYATVTLDSNGSWLIARDDNTLGRSFAFGWVAGGTPGISWQLSGTNIFTPNQGAITQNTWIHIAVAGTSGGSWTDYLNGASSQTASNAATFSSTTGSTTIAQRTFSGFSGHWPGRIADVAMWNVILSAGEIAALAVGARPYTVRQKSILGYWPLDGLQSPEPDFSGAGHNGTLITAPVLAAGPPIALFTPRWPRNFPAGAIAGGGAVKFRRTLSELGTRAGSRQRQAA